MQLGLAISLILHGTFLGWALVSINATPPLRVPEIQPVEVAIISPDELIRLRKGDRNSKKLETRKAKAPKKTKPKKKIVKKVVPRAVEPPRAEPPPPKAAQKEPAKKLPVPQPEDVIAKKLAALQPLPKPGPTPAELKQKAKAERKAKETERKKAEAEKKRKAEAKKRAEKNKRKAEEKRRKDKAKKLAEKKRRARRKKKKKFDPDKLAALLNKIPDQSAPPSGSEDSPANKKLPKGPRAGAREGRDARLTASQRSLLGAMMKRAVRECWRVQTGLSGADRLIVEVEVKLHETGELKGEPQVLNGRSDPIFRDAVISAVRALKQCEPYDLPKKLYKGGWDHMVVTFDPQRMF